MILHTAAPSYYTDRSIVTAVDTQNLVWDSGNHNSDSDCRSCHGIHLSYPSAICHSLGTDNGFLPVKKQEYSFTHERRKKCIPGHFSSLHMDYGLIPSPCGRREMWPGYETTWNGNEAELVIYPIVVTSQLAVVSVQEERGVWQI